ncbi:hypothetical protein BGZ60DRAFT_406825 [Tricladium varicosporioides]|nr:hypothetical protein BGZ60DRAFT_406825 [Hymenoscyphus varicosporioides]
MCLVNLNPTYNGTTNVCTCEPSVGTVNPPILPPGTPRPLCPDTVCLAEMEPIYNFTSGYCYCDFLPGFSKRSDEAFEDEDIKGRDVLPPVANKCVDTLCVGERQAVWNTTTKACECSYIPGMEPAPQVLCPDTMCTAEKEPIFNFTSGVCYCEWLPEFFTKKSALPVSLKEISEVEEVIPCHGMACMSEMRPVWNATSMTCKCEWIPGMEFSPLPSISSASKTTPTLPKPTKKQPCGVIACMGRIDLNTCTCDTSQGEAAKRDEESYEPTTTKTYIHPVPTSKPQPTTTITYINPHTPEPTTTKTYINPIPTTPKPSTPLESCTDMPVYHPCSMVKCPYSTTPIEVNGECICKPIKTLPPATLSSPTKTYILPRTTDSEGSIPACYNVTCPLAFQTPTWSPETTPHCSCVPIPGHTPSTWTSTPIGSLTSKPTWTGKTQTPTIIPWPITTKDIQTICPLGCPPPFSPTLDSNGRCACPSSMVSTPTTFKTIPWYPRYPPTGGTTTTPTPTPTPSGTTKTSSTWKWPSITPVPTGKGCAGWMCISEQRPVWDEVTGRCVCVWIDGFGPVTV